MYYITVKQSPIYHQITLEEFLFSNNTKTFVNDNTTNTRTYATEKIPDKFLSQQKIQGLIAKLHAFNESTLSLRLTDRDELYYSFHIPKRSGGLRRIDAPNDELMGALRLLKSIFENDFGALYHTSAFAYIKGRCALDAVKRHQANESKWFGKYDLSNFFGNTTLEYVMHMFSMVFPFSEVIKDKKGEFELKTALSLCFLNGGLPQGTPISPLITNIMMIPVDHKLANTFRNFGNQRYVYTRYADDFTISSKYEFNFRDVEKLIVDTLSEFGAPFSIKSEKTRYGSSSGRNWNLGVMLNKDNQITVGHKKKREFQAMLSSFILDTVNGKPWSIEDIMTMEGLRNYYRMVEKDTIDGIVNHISQKYHVDVVNMIKDAIRT